MLIQIIIMSRKYCFFVILLLATLLKCELLYIILGKARASREILIFFQIYFKVAFKFTGL